MTRQFKKLAHSLYECKYHVVFCPKYRYKIMQDEVTNYITQQIYRLSSQKDGVEVVEVNVQKDHVHLVVSIPAKRGGHNIRYVPAGRADAGGAGVAAGAKRGIT